MGSNAGGNASFMAYPRCAKYMHQLATAPKLLCTSITGLLSLASFFSAICCSSSRAEEWQRCLYTFFSQQWAHARAGGGQYFCSSLPAPMVLLEQSRADMHVVLLRISRGLLEWRLLNHEKGVPQDKPNPCTEIRYKWRIRRQGGESLLTATSKLQIPCAKNFIKQKVLGYIFRFCNHERSGSQQLWYTWETAAWFLDGSSGIFLWNAVWVINNTWQKHERPKLCLEPLLLNVLNKEEERVTPGVEASSKSCTERLRQEEPGTDKEVPELAELCQEHVFSAGSPTLPFVPLGGQKYELFIAPSVHFEIILSCLGASVDILFVYCTF